jgi:hypothetical protein
VLPGGTSAQLAEVLGISIPEPSSSESRPRVAPVQVPSLWPPAPEAFTYLNRQLSSPAQQATTPHRLEAVGAHLRTGGGLQLFHGFAARAGQAESALQTWIARQSTGSAGVGDTPAPQTQAWTELLTHMTSNTDSDGNQIWVTYGGYRLNDINTGADWFMVTTNVTDIPHWETKCDGEDVNCGWRSSRRLVGINSLDQYRPFVLFDHGPGTTPSTSTAELSIGASLNAGSDVTPGVSAVYNVYWSQDSVSTVDNSSPQGGGDWTTSFEGWKYDVVKVQPPPANSTSTYSDFQGAIFQAPEATPQFRVGVGASMESVYDHGIICGVVKCESTRVDDNWAEVSVVVELYAPVFAVTAPTTPLILQAPPAEPSSTSIQIQAHVPQSTQEVTWVIGNIPSWLSVSQVSGAGDATVQLAVEPGTPSGSSAVLNIDSNPSAAAANLERGPLQLQVCVASCP